MAQRSGTAAVLCVICIFIANICPAQESAENGSEKTYEWPMIAGNSGWTGYSPDPSVKPPFRLKWATQPGGGAGNLLVADRKVFSGGCCLDAETGEVLWKARIDSPKSTYHKGRLYTCRGSVTSYDAATGKKLWSKPGFTIPRARTVMTVCAGTIYVGRIKEREGKKFCFANALDAETGKEIWSTPLVAVKKAKSGGYELGMGMGAPTVGGGMVLVPTHSPKMVFALDQKTGKELWRQEEATAKYALGTDGKTVWAADYSQGLWTLDAKTGKKLWHWGGCDKGAGKANYQITGTTRYPPVVAYGILITCNYGRRYTALDAKTGKQLWIAGDSKAHVWAGSCGQPTAAGGYIFTNGTVGKDFNGPKYRWAAYALDHKTQKVVWRHPTSGKACHRIAIAYGRLYVPSHHEISCFEPVGPDCKNEPQPAPAEPAEPLAALAKPFDGTPGTAEAGGKPKGGTDWPMYGGCPARCGLELKIGLPIKEAWNFNTVGKAKSSPVIAQGIVYAGSDSGEFFALDLATGKKKWSAEIGSWVRCAPAVADGIAVCGADDGILRAYNAKTGKLKWQFRTAGRIRSSPAIVGDRVVFGSWDGRCYCVRLTDGKEFWRWRVGDPGVRPCAPAAVAGGRVYVGAWEDRKIHALDLGTGKPMAGYKTRSGYGTKVGLVEGLALYRGLVVTCRAASSGQLIDPASGKVLCKALGRRSSALPTLPAFSGEMVYCNTSSRGASLQEALSTAKGAKKKRRLALLKKPALNASLVCGNLMVVATGKGTVEAYRLPDEKSEDRAKLVWDWKSPSGAEIHTAPAAAAGFLVMGSDDGNVYGFRYGEE